MLNRVIYGGEVYYKLTDLAELFDISQYKIRKAIKEQNIQITRLKGFGRSLFVLEKNVSTIEVNGEITIIKTEVKESQEKTKVVSTTKANKTSLKKTPTKKKKKSSKNDLGETTGNIVNFLNSTEREHKELIRKVSAQYLRFHKALKESLAHEIIEKHLGKGVKYKEAPIEKMAELRLIIEELKSGAKKFTV